MGRDVLAEGTERWLLNAVRLPGRLNVEQAAQLIGCQAHDIPNLVKAQLLKPLGGGPRNSVKYFAAVVSSKRFVTFAGWTEQRKPSAAAKAPASNLKFHAN